MGKIRELYKQYREVISYLFFGVATTLVNWIVYSICIKLLHLEMLPSNALAWFLAVLFAFVTNKIYVFQSRTKDLKSLIWEFCSFFGSRALTGVLEIFLPGILYSIGLNQSIFGVEGFAAKVVVSVLVIILNYVFSKLFVFKK